MQERVMILLECRTRLSILISDTNQFRYDPTSDLYQCQLRDTFIGGNSAKPPDPDFVKGVCKIQANNITAMTDAEHLACSHLRLIDSALSSSASSGNEPDLLSYKERVELFKRRKTSK